MAAPRINAAVVKSDTMTPRALDAMILMAKASFAVRRGNYASGWLDFGY
jgi:hypothetical protein